MTCTTFTTVDQTGLVTARSLGEATIIAKTQDGGLVQKCLIIVKFPQVEPIVSVAIDNYANARPQSGLQEAEMVYEALVAPGITRFLAVYDLSRLTNDVKIGPVRSAREHSVELASGHGEGFAHAGGSTEALNLLPQSNVVNLDEIYGSGKYFYRSGDRNMPYNLYTSSDRLLQGLTERTEELIPPDDMLPRGTISEVLRQIR